MAGVLMGMSFVAGAQMVAQMATPLHWVGSWAASQQIPEPQNALPAEALRDATLRETVHLSAGGVVVRVHLSNEFGTSALLLTSVHIAAPAAVAEAAKVGQIDPATDHAVLFAGAAAVSIPPGAEYVSDPVSMSVHEGANLIVSMHFDTEPAQQTGHPGSRATSYLAHGDQVSAVTLADAQHFEHWYTLSAIDVSTPRSSWSIVALGDSITDGHASTTDGNDRWPDALARRLAKIPGMAEVGVLNQGIGGNHLLTDGLGPNVLARFDRDVLAQTGARVVIVLEGVNDLGMLSRANDLDPKDHAAKVDAMLAAYQQVITRAHAAGLRVVGGTVMPYAGSDYYHPGALELADLDRVNAWIRQPGHFDAVIDFSKAMADPAHPTHLLPKYDSGDHLHPSPAGYQAMADAIDLKMLARLAK
jgi:lysophospholipase L1-like esterase